MTIGQTQVAEGSSNRQDEQNQQEGGDSPP